MLVGLIGTGAHHLSCYDTRVLVTLVEQTVHELRKTVNDQFRLLSNSCCVFITEREVEALG